MFFRKQERRQWVKNKYKTLDALNYAYRWGATNTCHTNWEQVVLYGIQYKFLYRERRYMERHFFFSTKALIIKDNKYLAMYKIIDGKKWWDLPGGRMEFGETPEETFAREIKEELGVEVRPIRLIDTWNYMPKENFQTVGIIYLSEIISGEITISDEHDGFEWMSIEDIGTVFTRQAFVERMKLWDWNLIMP